MTATREKLTGGVFQDSEGNVLSSGYLEMTLSQDGEVASVGQIASGITIKILLDPNGSIEGTSALTLTAATSAGVYTGTISGGANNAFAGLTFVVAGFAASAGANNGTFVCTASTATTLTLANGSAVNETHSGTATAKQAVWGNDQMLPTNSYYRVTGYTATGQPAWGPNNQQVNGSGGSFDVGTWVPNTVLSWTPPLQPLELETNGTPNSTQALLNLTGSGGIVASEALGTVTIDGSGITPTWGDIVGTLSDQTDLQSALNLKAPLASPALTGVPTAPTAAPGTNTTQLATTAFVHAAVTTPLFIPLGYNVLVTSANVGTTLSTGLSAIFEGVLSATTYLAPTGTEPGYRLQNTGSGGSSNTSYCGENSGTNYRGSPMDMMTRFATKVKLNATTNIIVFLGVSSVASANTQNTFNTDTPNTNFVGFRYSSGTDATWKLVSCTDSSHITVSDTGVAVDTSNPQTLQWDYDGSTLTARINGALTTASISTNIPAQNMAMINSIGNKNTSNAQTCNWSFMYRWVK